MGHYKNLTTLIKMWIRLVSINGDIDTNEVVASYCATVH